MLYIVVMKNAWLAAILNLFPGIGYIYIGGSRLVFGIMLVSFWPIVIIGTLIQQIFQPNIFSNTSATPNSALDTTSIPVPVGVVTAIVLVWISFAVDAYLEVQQGNRISTK